MNDPLNIRLTAGAAAFCILLSGCGNLGTGVVVWPPEESRWEPGSLVTVKDESLLRSTYIVNLPDQRRLKEEIDQWRIRLFRRRREAAVWAAEMGEWRNVYAESMFQGLPMRSEPSNTSDRVFRFREGDVAKVLGREPGPVPVGNLEGFWYHVLADGGVEGYVFDYHLRVMRISGGTSEILNARNRADPDLENFLQGPWRPKYFDEMVRDGRIDLNLFKPAYGLFPDPDNRTLHLRLPDISHSAQWTEIVSAGPKRYDFLGAGFRITINSDFFVSVQYNIDGRERYEAYVRLGRGVNAVIADETARRRSVFNRFIENGPVYGSRAYGILSFLDGSRFTWSGKSSLISRGIISLEAGPSGSVVFDSFMDSNTAASYDGVLTLRFDNGESARFLYVFEREGLRMLYVPPGSAVDGLVRTDQYLDPVQLFFVPSGTQTPGNP